MNMLDLGLLAITRGPETRDHVGGEGTPNASSVLATLGVGLLGGVIGWKVRGKKAAIGGAFAGSVIGYLLASGDEPVVLDAWGVPFANGRGKVWPVANATNRRVTTGPLAFHASREGGRRYHAGMDLYSYAGDTIVALDDGAFQNYAAGYVGLDAMVIRHGRNNVLYGEFVADKGFKHGDPIVAGQRLGTMVESKGTSPGTVLSSMLHLEIWDISFTPQAFTPWYSKDPIPRGLLDPTRFLERTLASL